MKILQQVTSAIRNGREIESTEILISKSKNRNEKRQNENRSRRTHCTETRVTHEIKIVITRLKTISFQCSIPSTIS